LPVKRGNLPELHRPSVQTSDLSSKRRNRRATLGDCSADDQARLHHQLVFQHKLGLPLQWITPAETRQREPHLAGKLAGAVWSPEDHQVDNRELASALRIAAEGKGAIVREHIQVKEISITDGSADGIILADETRVSADVVVLAAGAWSRDIVGLPHELRPPVRPIKGHNAVNATASLYIVVTTTSPAVART
jgi:glycine oxidase